MIRLKSKEEDIRAGIVITQASLFFVTNLKKLTPTKASWNISMNIGQKFNFNFDIAEPKQKNNIVVFFLSSKEQMKANFLAFPEALKNDLAKVEEVNKGFVGNLKVTNNIKPPKATYFRIRNAYWK